MLVGIGVSCYWKDVLLPDDGSCTLQAMHGQDAAAALVDTADPILALSLAALLTATRPLTWG